jgi:hypothetical protein
MKTRNIYEPYIGQLWSGSDMTKFRIKDLTIQEDDAWVSYENCQTQQAYSCRLEAFQNRFTPGVE